MMLCENKENIDYLATFLHNRFFIQPAPGMLSIPVAFETSKLLKTCGNIVHIDIDNYTMRVMQQCFSYARMTVVYD